MSFLEQILEDREYNNDIAQLQEELTEIEQTLDQLKEKANKLNEDAMDFPNQSSVGEIFDEAMKRLKTAKWAFGLTNKLKNPEDKKKHRRNIIIVMNKLRALVNKLVKELTVEADDGGMPNDSRTTARPGEGRMVTPSRTQDSYGRHNRGNGATSIAPSNPSFMT